MMKGATTRVWLVIAGFAFLITVVNSLIVQQRPAATLTIEMQSSVASHAKAFFDTGDGVNELESDERPVPGGPDAHLLFFPFPLKTVRAIRFDPLDKVGVVEVRSAVVERPGSHRIVRKFDVTGISPLNQIASISVREGSARIATVEGADDPQVALPLESPVTAYYSAVQLFSGRILVVDALCALVALSALVATRRRRRWGPPIHGTTAG